MKFSKKQFALCALASAILTGCVIERDPVDGNTGGGDAAGGGTGGGNTGGDNTGGTASTILDGTNAQLADINLFAVPDLALPVIPDGTEDPEPRIEVTNGAKSASIHSIDLTLKNLDNTDAIAKKITYWEYESNFTTWKNGDHLGFVGDCATAAESDSPKAHCIALSRPNAKDDDKSVTVSGRVTQKNIYGLVGGVEYAVEATTFTNSKSGQIGLEVELLNEADEVIDTIKTEGSLTDQTWFTPQFRFTISPENYAKGWTKTNISLTASETPGLIRIAQMKLSVPVGNTVSVGALDTDSKVSVTINGNDPLNTVQSQPFKDLGAKFISDANNKFKYAWIESLKIKGGEIEYSAPAAYADQLDAYNAELNTQGIKAITYLDFPVASGDVGDFTSDLVGLEENGIFDKANLRWAAAAAYYFAKEHADEYQVVGALNYSLRRLEDAGLADVTNTGEEYFDLLKAVHMGIKAASPDMQVSAFSFAGDEHFKNAAKEGSNTKETVLVKNGIALGMDQYFDIINQNRRPITASTGVNYSLASADKLPLVSLMQNTSILTGVLKSACEEVKTGTSATACASTPLWVTGLGVPSKPDTDTIFAVEIGETEINKSNAVVLADNNDSGTLSLMNSTVDADLQGKTYFEGNETGQESVFVADSNAALQAVAEVSVSFAGGAEKVFVQTMDNIDSGLEGIGEGKDLYGLKDKKLTAVTGLTNLLAGTTLTGGNAGLHKTLYSGDPKSNDATNFQYSIHNKSSKNYFVISVTRVVAAHADKHNISYFAELIEGLDGTQAATVHTFEPGADDSSGSWSTADNVNLAETKIIVDSPIVVVQDAPSNAG